MAWFIVHSDTVRYFPIPPPAYGAGLQCKTVNGRLIPSGSFFPGPHIFSSAIANPLQALVLGSSLASTLCTIKGTVSKVQ